MDKEATRKRLLMISPSRPDMFSDQTDQNPYAEIMLNKQLDDEKTEVVKQINENRTKHVIIGPVMDPECIPKKRSRWDKSIKDKPTASSSQMHDETPGRGIIKNEMWNETPGTVSNRNGDDMDCDTPASYSRRSRFGETPQTYGYSKSEMDTPRSERSDLMSITPGGCSSRRKSRWDAASTRGAETPAPQGGMTPAIGFYGDATPSGSVSMDIQTPRRGAGETPSRFVFVDRDYDPHSVQLSDVYLDSVLPDGYRMVKPPKGYANRQLSRKSRVTATPTPRGSAIGGVGASPSLGANFVMQTPGGPGHMDKMNQAARGALDEIDEIPICAEDTVLFEKLLREDDGGTTGPGSIVRAKEKEVLTLILKIKNGDPRTRRSAMREVTRRAQEFGAPLLLDNILPVLVEQAIDEQQRHLMVKLLDRLMYRLEERVRPYTHKILIIVMPMLIDEERVARQEGREIISNLAKIVGLPTMISALRPDIDNEDDSVRKVTACSFAVLAHSLGLAPLLPFIKAVCTSKKGWKVRHTGMRIVREIASSMRCGVLPFLHQLVGLVSGGLSDDNTSVKTMMVLAVSSLAEAVTPYGVEAFADVLKPLWKECRTTRGKHLAAVIKAISFLIPLMEKSYRVYYTTNIIQVIVRNFPTPDESFKLVLLSTIEKICQSDALPREVVVSEVLPAFFKCFWNSRSAVVKPVYAGVVETVLAMANTVGVREVVTRTLHHIKSDTELFKRMAMETCDRVIATFGVAELDDRMVELLMDALKCAFEEQKTDQHGVMISSFGNVVNALGRRCEPYVEPLIAEAASRMSNRTAGVRKQAAEVMGRLAKPAKVCGKMACLVRMSQLLFEYLGEEFPDALGSIIKALELVLREHGLSDADEDATAAPTSSAMAAMMSGCYGAPPPVTELLPRLTPILKNRQEKVQESCLDLVGLIAARAGDQVSSREWMRVCFDMVEILKSPNKAIRRAAILSFGFIAATVGPSDVVATLLTNLKTQERQNRICSTVAVAVVAERCRPFTVLPLVMNEYRVADLFVQHGVLKSLAFMFEYVGEEMVSYVDAVAPLLAEALTERDPVHRQTALTAVSHLALCVVGTGREDALVHLLNAAWPNVLETSPHVRQAFVRAIEALSVALGAPSLLQYVIQSLWHPSRTVRTANWRVYNCLYMSRPDSLVAAYPRVEDEMYTLLPISNTAAKESIRRYTRTMLHCSL